jgi:hypothetical protein
MYFQRKNNFPFVLNELIGFKRGERSIWSGQPQQGGMLRRGDVFIIPISLMNLISGCFVIIWGFMEDIFDDSIFVTLLFLPYLLYSLYFLIGRFFFNSVQRRKTFYTLTNERVIIISGVFKQPVKILDIKDLPEVNINMGRKGKGTIIFGASHPNAYIWEAYGFPTNKHIRSKPAPIFDMIDDVKTIYQHIQGLQKESD